MYEDSLFSTPSPAFIICRLFILFFNKCVYFWLLWVFFKNKFIYLFIFWLHGVSVAAWAFSSCGEQGLLLVAVHGLLIAVASLVADHGL